MLNKKSRPLVTRAFYASGTGLNPIFYPWRGPSQLQQMKTCFQFSDTAPLIDYLKTANSSALARCKGGPWMPAIENKSAPQAFLTEEPENILKSSDAPVIDAVFSFTSQVFQREKERKIRIFIFGDFLGGCSTFATFNSIVGSIDQRELERVNLFTPMERFHQDCLSKGE